MTGVQTCALPILSQKKAVELMGHADIKMIMEVYAHLDDKKEAVQEKLSNAISL